jgi:acyl-CoA synthetase (AMP-forming)/AMP-acid ligase II/pyrroloquinoline quinone (PQQ) biosynthesis protein C
MTLLLDSIWVRGAADPDRIALDDGSGVTIGYRELASLTSERAEKLRGAFADDVPVALQLDHGIENSLTEIALLEAGIPVLSLPLFFTRNQLDHAISACGAQALSDTTLGFDVSHRKAAPSSSPTPLPPGTARITFTSGSTGTPKGVCLSAGHMLAVAEAVVGTIGAQHAGRHLALLPPGILLETVAGFFATLIAGGTYVCPPQRDVGLENPFRPDFAQMLRAIADLRITSLILVPEYLAGLVAAIERSGSRLPLLTVVAVGGAHTAPELIARARALGLPVRHGYGLTECASVVSLDDPSGEPGSVGRPLPHLKLRIAEDGEIMIDGPLFLGTIGEPRETGSLATGDIGHIDHQGRLWIDGRKTNLLVTGFGRNISPEWVEAALLAQPGIAQAMVYGDGLPAPEALLVPARPDSDLAAAVAAANASLPDYARVAHWREVAHFTPANGRLTANGRLRRKEIAAAYLDGEPDFYTELEAATVRQRLAFLAIPQLQAGLAGAITRTAYLDYLAQAYHHVRHTVPLMCAAHERLGRRPELIAALDEYIDEEEGHEEWILADIAAAGGDADAVRYGKPAPATQAMVEHAYRIIREGNPVAFFGMVYVLESVSVALAHNGASAVARNLGLPKEAFTYLNSHGALDQHHLVFFANLVNRFDDPRDRAAVIRMARDMFHLFGGVFASIELEREHVAA